MEYLDYYGLEFNPFELPVDAIFSKAGGRAQLLEKIEHLVAFSELNIFIYGQEGIGKTNFLKHLIAIPSAMWKSVYIPVTEDSNFDFVLEKILAQYNLDLSQNSSLEIVAAEVSDLLQSNNQNLLLLCFDDAHLMQSEMFNLIQDLKNSFEKYDIQIKVLFTGEQALLEEKCEYAEDVKLSYHLFLESFDINDTKSYLATYFRMAAKSDKLPISNADIKRIFEMSQGIPGKINSITPEYLLQSLNQPARRIQLPAIKVSLGILLLIFLIALFYFKQSSENDIEEVAPVLINESPKTLMESNSVLEKLEQAKAKLENIENEVEEQEVLKKQSLEEVKIKPNLVDEIVESDDVEKAEQQIQNEKPLIQIEEPLLVKPEVKLIKIDPIIDEVDAFVEPEKQVSLSKETINNNWFRDNTGWVLQVLGSHKEISVDDFVEKFPSYKWKKYQRVLNGKNYYVIVISGFETKALAEKQKLTLPSQIIKLQPWNRSIESIRPLLDQ